jgi:hypothetical protein
LGFPSTGPTTQKCHIRAVGCMSTRHKVLNEKYFIQTNSVAFSPQASYTDWRPPLVDEI